MEANPNIIRGNVREKILAWEARIKNYNENEIRECKGGNNDYIEADKQTNNPVEFTKGDSVLLRHSETETPTDEPSPWWYGPFTIKSLHQDGIVSLTSKGGGEVTANVERLRHHHPDNKDHIYQGYVIMNDGVT